MLVTYILWVNHYLFLSILSSFYNTFNLLADSESSVSVNFDVVYCCNSMKNNRRDPILTKKYFDVY